MGKKRAINLAKDSDTLLDNNQQKYLDKIVGEFEKNKK